VTTFDVSSVGFYVLDILGRPVTAIPPGGRCFFIDEIAMTVAGTAGASAMACAILGLKTRAVGSVGDDEMGDIMLGALGRKGVDTALVERFPGVATSATILPVRPNGERPALHVPGSAAHFRVKPESEDAALDARFIHFGGTGLMKAFDGEPTLHLIKKAKALGRTTTFDLIQANLETIALVEPLLPHIDYFIPSIDEASEMSGRTDPDDVAKFFLDRGVGTCALTMGGDGCIIVSKEGTRVRLPAHDVAVSDTTGCGDSYTSGFIVGLHHGWDLERCGRFATAVSAIVATGLGSNAKLVSFEATLEAMSMLPLRAA